MDKRVPFNYSNNHQHNHQSLNGILPNMQNIIPTLQLLWKNEKFAKELLKYEEAVFSRLFPQIEQREEEIKKNTYSKEDSDLIELDIQRIKFLIKEYHRIRLFKIEKYLFHILKNDLSSFLSQKEIQFTVDLINMKAIYFNEGLKKVSPLVNNFKPFLDKFKSMSDKVSALNDEMIVNPSKKAYVVIHANEGSNIVLNMKDVSDDAELEVKVIKEGDIEAVPFALIKEALKEKKVQLI